MRAYRLVGILALVTIGAGMAGEQSPPPLESQAGESVSPPVDPRGRHLPERTLRARVKQFERAVQVRVVLEKLADVGIDQELALRLFKDPQNLRRSIRALETLQKLGSEK